MLFEILEDRVQAMRLQILTESLRRSWLLKILRHPIEDLGEAVSGRRPRHFASKASFADLSDPREFSADLHPPIEGEVGAGEDDEVVVVDVKSLRRIGIRCVEPVLEG
jgi:hypothetical protein